MHAIGKHIGYPCARIRNGLVCMMVGGSEAIHFTGPDQAPTLSETFEYQLNFFFFFLPQVGAEFMAREIGGCDFPILDNTSNER